MTLVQDKSRHALVRGRWSLSVALVVVFSVVMNTYGQHSTAAQKALPTLTTARAAHSLQPDEAKRHYPVRLRVVVTYTTPILIQRLAPSLLVIQPAAYVSWFHRGPFFLSGRAP